MRLLLIKALTLSLIAFFGSALLSAVVPAQSPWHLKTFQQKEYYALLGEMREGYVYQVAPESGLVRSYNKIMAFIKAAPYSAQDKAYLRANTNYWMGFAYQRFDSPQKAYNFITASNKKHFKKLPTYYDNSAKATLYQEKALSMASAGHKKYPKDPRFLFVMAFANANLVSLKGTGYAMAHGLSTFTYTKDALKIDPNFDGPHSVWVTFYKGLDRKIFAPPGLGSEPEKALAQLKELAKENPYHAHRDKFEVLMRMAYCYVLIGDKEEARRYMERALELYPNDNYIRGMAMYAKIKLPRTSVPVQKSAPPAKPPVKPSFWHRILEFFHFVKPAQTEQSKGSGKA